MRKIRILQILTAFILFFGLSYIVYIINPKPLTLVSISINPDVELVVNSDYIVEEVLPINEEADVITSDLELIGESIYTATEKIVDAAVETGFIDEYSDKNTIIVTAVNEEEQARKRIEEKVVERIQTHLQTKKIYSLVVKNGVNDEIRQAAKQFNISNGKMLLINRAIIINPELSEEELADMSIKEIQAVIKDNVSERHAKRKESINELREIWKEEKDELIKTKRKNFEDLKASLLEESTVNLESMTKEQKEKMISERLKARKNEIKARIDKVKEAVDNALKDSGSTTDIKNEISRIRQRITEKSN